MIYPYVGPEAIRQAASSQPEGAAIRAPADLQRWLAAHPGAITEPATFVVTLDGTLRVAPRRSEHVACAGGQPVLAAGEVRFERGAPAGDIAAARFRVALITNQSTGYCPEPDCWSAVAAALASAGIEHPAALTHAFIFRRCDACEQINLIKDDWFVCGNCEADLPRARNFPTRVAPSATDLGEGVRRILHEDWDPIGVAQFEGAAGQWG
ncbi:MAG: hypothetical protein JWM53_5812 [bacterium]|nr:hypothetical protein [bacterium]